MSHLAQYAVTVARGASLAPPPPASRFRRFLWGFALPFGIVRSVLRDPHARRCWLAWSSVQLAVLVAVGLRIGLSTSHAADHLARPKLSDVVELASVTYAALCVVEWFVIALARDYHEVLSAIAARVTGVPAEPLVRPPKSGSISAGCGRRASGASARRSSSPAVCRSSRSSFRSRWSATRST